MLCSWHSRQPLMHSYLPFPTSRTQNKHTLVKWASLQTNKLPLSLLFITLPLLPHHQAQLALKMPCSPSLPAGASSYRMGSQNCKHWSIITHSINPIIPPLQQIKANENPRVILSGPQQGLQAWISTETSKMRFFCNEVLTKPVLLARKSKQVTQNDQMQMQKVLD